jgi:hypothetical protein
MGYSGDRFRDCRRSRSRRDSHGSSEHSRSNGCGQSGVCRSANGKRRSGVFAGRTRWPRRGSSTRSRPDGMRSWRGGTSGTRSPDTVASSPPRERSCSDGDHRRRGRGGGCHEPGQVLAVPRGEARQAVRAGTPVPGGSRRTHRTASGIEQMACSSSSTPRWPTSSRNSTSGRRVNGSARKCIGTYRRSCSARLSIAPLDECSAGRGGALGGSFGRVAQPALHARNLYLERQRGRDIKVPKGGSSPLAPTRTSLLFVAQQS